MAKDKLTYDALDIHEVFKQLLEAPTVRAVAVARALLKNDDFVPGEDEVKKSIDALEGPHPKPQPRKDGEEPIVPATALLELTANAYAERSESAMEAFTYLKEMGVLTQALLDAYIKNSDSGLSDDRRKSRINLDAGVRILENARDVAQRRVLPPDIQPVLESTIKPGNPAP